MQVRPFQRRLLHPPGLADSPCPAPPRPDCLRSCICEAARPRHRRALPSAQLSIGPLRFSPFSLGTAILVLRATPTPHTALRLLTMLAGVIRSRYFPLRPPATGHLSPVSDLFPPLLCCNAFRTRNHLFSRSHRLPLQTSPFWLRQIPCTRGPPSCIFSPCLHLP